MPQRVGGTRAPVGTLKGGVGTGGPVGAEHPFP